jgi:hypothetical protein
MTAPRCALVGRVDRHFEGGLSPTDEHAMREHLPTCASCTARYERQLLLEAIDPVALGPERRIGRGLGLGPAGGGAKVLRWAAPVAAALAVAAALLLVFGLRDPSNAGFTARGGDANAGAELFVYRAIDHGQPTRAGGSLGPHDELAFAYENPSAKPYLMIFGADEQRRIVWYYPAWSNEADDPSSIHADTAPGRHRLADAVAHDLSGGTLEVHALFSDHPLTVKTVERLVAASPPKVPIAFPSGVVDTAVSFTVER